MIKSFRHRGLQRLYEKGVRKGLNPGHLKKIERILARLDEASEPGHLDLPGYRLHPLKGELVGFWSVTVAANWRIIFRFAQGDVLDVDYVDYH